MESASFVESRSDLQTFHFCLCPTDKNEFVRIVFKGGKRKGMVVTAYGVNPEKPDVPLNKNDAFQKVQKRRVQEKR